MDYTNLSYVLSSVLFILGIKKLSHPKTARNGNLLAFIAMFIAIIATLISYDQLDYKIIFIGIAIGAIIGSVFAVKVEMTQMPQMVAIFNGFGGAASALVAAAEYLNPTFKMGQTAIDPFTLGTITLSIFIGTLTFTGSFIAFGKLQGFISGQPIVFSGNQLLNAIIAIGLIITGYLLIQNPNDHNYFYLIITLSALIGITLTIPIGGADMPVVVSMLNSYSGWAAAGIGFTLQNTALIIVGALVGSSGAILSYIMCKAMNRSFISVILGGFGAAIEDEKTGNKNKNAKAGSAEDAAFIMQNSQNVVIVPGYGMAVAQAQHIVREMTDKLKSSGVSVKYAIHPVAGRMPGHMNVLLAEANVPYDEVFELEDINSDFSSTDVAFVIGANDVTNPAAKTDPASPIAGMPILEVERAKTVLFVKRSLSPGYAGIDNDVFYNENTMMLFDDAKKMLEKIVQALD